MIKQISGDEITNLSGTILDAMRGRFAGVSVGTRSVLVRGGSARFDSDVGGAAWDVDGNLYNGDSPPYHINVNNVKSITVMPASWAQARYGMLASGGIVIIRTISGSFDDMKARKDHLYDQPMLRNNIYKGDAVYFENKLDSQPKYLRAIANETTFENAYQQYLLQRNSYGHLAHFYVDVHNHFSQKWKLEKIANTILSNIEELFNNDVNALKVLAYTYEEKGLNLKTQSIYETIYALKPVLVQSQRDLAHCYAKLGNYKKAWLLYGKHIKTVNDSLATNGTDVIVKNELLDLLQYHGADMDIDVSQYIFDTEKGDMTLSVEWNNPNTQFELQFVGPEQHYYNWNNAVDISNAQLLKGNFSNSFTIDDLSKGQWLINIKYLGNYENTPSYLKFTIKDNKTGKETIKTVKLYTRNIFYKFMSISPPDQIVSY
ncbi:MAG: hypothetical protein COA50_05770 [Flavobacteriaceae bacterium]|nr:MAG: hypothetical protein COA50_05770 [Flavobacteriaceae bacterium]